MSLITTACGILAELDRFERLKALRQGLGADTDDSSHAAIVMGVAALGGLIAVTVKYLLALTDPGRRHDLSYLTQGARVAGLSGQEARDLEMVATRANLPYPAVILLSPANLAVAVEAADPERTDTRLRERVSAVAAKLFETPLPDVTQGPARPDNPNTPPTSDRP